jgi:hypothetical protein
MMAIASPEWAHKQTLNRAMGTSVLAPKNRRHGVWANQSALCQERPVRSSERTLRARPLIDRNQVTTIEVDPLLSMRQTEFLAVAFASNFPQTN